MMRHLIVMLLLTLGLSAEAQKPQSVWNPNLPGGRYRNPIIQADYSDPDVCRVGDDFYMTASSFACMPGLPILHSRDLVNWTLVAYALNDHYPVLPQYRGTALDYRVAPQHGHYVWAPAIRHHDGWFYIYWGDPDQGLFMVKAREVTGQWSEPVLVKEGKGLIDCCPLWGPDGRAWLSHGCAGSRAGLKSVLFVAPLSDDGTHVTGPSRIVYDGHLTQPTIEGTKLYWHDGYYYIFSPAGGVKWGWQVELRSRDIYGPYEEKVTLAQGHTPVNGPHQGAWVDAPDGSQWFLHFQDQQAYGRVIHLQPARWKDGWLLIGKHGEPVEEGILPSVAEQSSKFKVQFPDDEFNSNTLGLQWQWEGPWSHYWYFCDERQGLLRLYGPQQPEYFHNLSDLQNMLLQKFPAENFTATARLRFIPNEGITATPFASGSNSGSNSSSDSNTSSNSDSSSNSSSDSAQPQQEEGGFVIMGLDYAGFKFVKGGFDENTEASGKDSANEQFNVQSSQFKVKGSQFKGKGKLAFVVCHDAQNGGREQTVWEEPIGMEPLPAPYTRRYGGDALAPTRRATPYIYLRVKVWSTGSGTAIQSHAQFSWSSDGRQFSPVGHPFLVREGKWIGAKLGFYSLRRSPNNDAPILDVDWIRFTPGQPQ